MRSTTSALAQSLLANHAKLTPIAQKLTAQGVSGTWRFLWFFRGCSWVAFLLLGLLNSFRIETRVAHELGSVWERGTALLMETSTATAACVRTTIDSLLT